MLNYILPIAYLMYIVYICELNNTKKNKIMNKILINELKQMMKDNKGYLSIKSFINDFDIKDVLMSDINEMSDFWTLSLNINSKKITRITSFNFGW